MDCDFFEQSYYYTHPGPQGERKSEDLSWLIYQVVIDLLDPKKKVGKTTDVVPKVIVSPLQSDPVLSGEHPNTQGEVIS